MALRRTLALVAAVVMVVGAFVARRALDGDPVSVLPDDGTPIVCERALAEVCREAFDGAVTIEDPGTTLDRLGVSPAPTRWVVDRLWAENLAAQARGVTVEIGPSLGTSPLVLVAVRGADAACTPGLTWGCLAEPSTSVTVGVAPSDTTAGLLVRGQLATGFFGSPVFATNDLGSSFSRWETDLAPSLRDIGALDPLGALFNGAGAYRVTAVAEADWLALGRTDAVVVEPVDAARGFDVVLVSVGEATVRDRDRDRIESALTARNWRAGVDVDQARPTAGVLEALRRRD